MPGVAGPVDIDLYDGNTLVQSIPANLYREDLANAGVGNGLHGFSLPTPLYLKDGQPHTLTARYGGSAVIVGGSPKTLQCAPPTPVYAGWLDADNCTWIAGWVWDSARPWTAVAIDLYANGQLIATTAAGVYRQDLANAGVGDGRHAFIVSTPVSLKTGQSYSIALKYAGTQTAVPGTPQALNCAPGTAATKLYFIENDHLSTPRRITDMAQQVVWRWDLEEPFGLTPAQENPSSLGTFEFNLRFPGQYRDPESNLHYNHHRDYDPQIGRYIQSDPIGLRGGINTYAYVNGNPLSYSDPDGLFAGPPALAGIGGGPLALAWIAGQATGSLVYWAFDRQIQAMLPDPTASTTPQNQSSPNDDSPEKRAERRAYHRDCDEPPPLNLSPCERLKWEIERAKRCIQKRKDYMNKWNDTYSGHFDQIAKRQANLARLEREFLRRCCGN